MTWKPSASIETLKKRSELIQKIRSFFLGRNVWEVETPLVCHATISDLHIDSIPATICNKGKEQVFYLQTSPEFAMKRLLAAGSGDIFQITKAFRQEEAGRWHNHEFTILEWYRLDFDHHQLMDEMDELLFVLLSSKKATRFSYVKLFEHYLSINPLTVGLDELKACALSANLDVQGDLSRDDWLQLLMSQLIEPKLGFDAPVFVYDFPASQAALARLNADNPAVASRFEVYVCGTELANGFHELSDAKEQKQRFIADLNARKAMGKHVPPLDDYFLEALEFGLPDCSGVALGVDRLMMLALGKKYLSDVIGFPIDQA